MYRVPPARAWWPAVGAPLERGVRPHCAVFDARGVDLPCREILPTYRGSKAQDAETLRDLPFGRAKDFTDVLLNLRDLGWVPTGYTKGAP